MQLNKAQKNSQSAIQKKHRNGKIRLAIQRFLESAAKPLSTVEILVHLKKQHSTANKTSVYRGIEILIRQGQVKEVDFGDNKKRYESAGLKHHHHLVCTNCQRVAEVYLKNEDLQAIEKNIARQNAFAKVYHNLEFFGLCNKCN